MSGFNSGWSWAVEAGILVVDEEARPLPPVTSFVPAVEGGEIIKFMKPISGTLTFKSSGLAAWDLWALLNGKKLAFTAVPGWNRRIYGAEHG